MLNVLILEHQSLCKRVLLIVSILVFSITLQTVAQQPQRQSRVSDGSTPPPRVSESELSKDNNDRVAASAIQIKAVFSRVRLENPAV